jgi:hypothetical protein
MNLNGILIGSEDPEGWIATFADPDNYFQLVSPFPG